MPKRKTRKAAAKRVTVTKKGKVKAAKAFTGHLLTSKNRKRKRHLKLKTTFGKVDSKKLREMIT
ncbi:50S ribosomal protein L35 [Candidatus Omnitrophota bacterium]